MTPSEINFRRSLLLLGLLGILFVADAEYRSYDGTGNNIANPLAGSAWTPFLQNHTTARTATWPEQQVPLTNITCPSTTATVAGVLAAGRCISDVAMSYDTAVTNITGRQRFLSTTYRTHMITHFAHYVSFDLTASAKSTTPSILIPMPVNDASYQSPGDFAFNASNPIPFQSTPQLTANSSSDPTKNKPVNGGLNTITGFLDQSGLYGSSLEDVTRLRGTGCLMKTALDSLGNEYPPRKAATPTEYDLGFYSARSGDIFTSLFSTLFLREHNLYCTQLKTANPTMDDTTAFEKTRAYVIGLLQHITFTEYLASVVGTTPPVYTGYNPNLLPGIEAMFATSIFRYGHTELSDSYEILDKQNQLIETLSFQDTRKRLILEDFGFENIARLLARQSQQEVDIYYSDGARNYFDATNSPVDLGQLDVLRSRDHLLPKYNEARVIYNLPPAKTWSDISSNTTIQQALQKLYAAVDDIDMTVGALCEDHDLRPSSSMGPLFRAGMMAQFVAIRDSDRFWYQAPGVLDPDALQAVMETNLRTLFLKHFKDNSTLPASIWMFAEDGETMPVVSSGVQFTPDYKVSWSLSPQYIEFEMSFTGPVGWFGLGLSPNPNMGGAQFFVVQHDTDNPNNLVLDKYTSNGDAVAPSYQGHMQPTLTPPTGGGPLTVKFQRPLGTQDDVQVGDSNIYVLYAYSPATRIGYHQGGDSHGYHQINFFTSIDSGNLNNSPRTTYKWHGIGMFICWAVIFPLSIFIVRYQKHRIGNAINLHRHIQLLTGFSITSLAAAAIATATPSMYRPHKIMGLTILAAVIGQLGLGVAAIYTLGQLESANQGFARIIKWMHRILGTGVLLLAWVNIYFGLQAYNAPFPVIIAYLVYISALIISVSVYHFRWHREGRTIRGERRIQVQDFLLGEDDKKGEKQNSLSQPLLSLPKITWDTINTRVNSGAKLVVVDDYVFDIREWIPSHPGGKKVLERVIGTDITADFYGHSGFASLASSPSSSSTALAGEKESLSRRGTKQTMHTNQLSSGSTTSISSMPQILPPNKLVGQLKYSRMTTNLPDSLKMFREAQRRGNSVYDPRKSFYGDPSRNSQAIDEVPEDDELGALNHDGVVFDTASEKEKKSLLDRLWDWFESLSHLADRYNIRLAGGNVNFGHGDDGDEDTHTSRALATHAHTARAIQRLARYCIGMIDLDNSSVVALRRKSTSRPNPVRKIFKRYMLTSKSTLTSNLASRPVRRFTFKPCTALDNKPKKTKRNNPKKMFMPGEFIEIQCAVDGQVLTRSYTPIEGNMDEEFAIYVKIYPDGMVSRFLDMQYPGYEIRIRGPFDLSEKYGFEADTPSGTTAVARVPRLLLNPQREDGRWNLLLMIAGGTGLTPALQMIHHHIRNQDLEARDPKDQTDMFLLCLNRSHRDIIAGQYLDKLIELSGNRLRVDYGINEANEKTPCIYKGHLTPETLKKWFASVYQRRNSQSQMELARMTDFGGEIRPASPGFLPASPGFMPVPGSPGLQQTFQEDVSDHRMTMIMNSFIRPGARVMVSGTPGMMDTALDFLEQSQFPPERCIVLH